MKEYAECAKEMLCFIENSPTCFHAVSNAGAMLKEQGFEELTETGEWKLRAGGGYFVTRNDSSLIAFRLPEEKKTQGDLDAEDWKGFHLVASHSDSPSFKIKEQPELAVDDKYVRLNTEKYGGMILSTWLDRALSVAGRIAVRDADKNIMTKLVNIDRELLVIPNVAIHLNRDMNKGVEYNPQSDMLPLFAECGGQVSGLLLQQIAGAAGVEECNILGHDLFLYVREKGRMFGADEEFILAPRLDDLQCMYASLQAFIKSRPKEYINVCAVFDNEEVGSGTKQGADSTFLEDTLFRIVRAFGFDREKLLRMIGGSFLISADNAHAVHPNHPEKSDPSNRPYLNGGIVIKYNGSQRYTTDGVSAAKMKDICERAGVPWQSYANRSDITGGATLGNLSTSHVSVSSVDIGLPQLAMHSAVETAGVRDTEYAVKAFCEFWQE